MTYQKFLECLGQSPRKWRLMHGSEGKNDGLLRFESGLMGFLFSPLYCPKTYVCKKVTGEFFSTAEHHRAGQRICLPSPLDDALAWAADGCGVHPNFSREQMAKFRRDLLIVTGLMPKIPSHESKRIVEPPAKTGIPEPACV